MGRPGPDGRFGEFGGRFVPESLMPACLELEKWFDDAWGDPAFRAELDGLLRHYGGRPTPVTECARLSEQLGVRVLLKREDLAHTGSHKLNNVVGQALLTKRMGKARMIAETGAGQHGVAAATAAALFGLECTVFMGEVDTKRQELNVFRMELLGAEVRTGHVGEPHAQGRGQRGDAGVGGDGGDHALLPRVGHGAAPVPLHGAPVPARRRRGGARPVPRRCSAAPIPTSSWPASAAARTRRGRSPASWTRRRGWSAWRRPAARPSPTASPASCTACTRASSRTRPARSRRRSRSRPGLDYPGLGPEHAHLAAIGRAEYSTANDAEVLDAFRLLSHTEGIIPALESAHAVAWVARCAGTDALPAGSTVLITLSGRGDKDVAQVREIFGRERDA